MVFGLISSHLSSILKVYLQNTFFFKLQQMILKYESINVFILTHMYVHTLVVSCGSTPNLSTSVQTTLR